VWRVIENDRAQRQMLKCAVEATRWEAEDEHRAADILWVLEKTNSMAEDRNNAIHSPYQLFSYQGTSVIRSDNSYGHPRAEKLSNKDLITEFRWCFHRTSTLSYFALEMEITFVDVQTPWPERPTLPERERKNTSQG
jgi:hypothetical protein